MPDEMTINGQRYLRVEGLVIDGCIYIPDKGAMDEMMTVAEISEMTGKSIHAINDAMNDDRLPYKVPLGCKRPRRARRGDVLAWMSGGRATCAEA